MLSEFELKKYYTQHGLSRYAIEYIDATINSAPSRLVGTKARGNVCTDFVSTKNGCSIQTESRTAENSFAIEFEFADSIVAYFDQPPVVMVVRTYKNGSRRPGSYHSDFVVLGANGPEVLEVKTEEELQKLIEEKPDDWHFENGEYIYWPARRKFAELGLIHRVRSTSELNKIRTENLRLLIYARESEYILTEATRHKVLKAFGDSAWMRMSILLEIMGEIDTTPIFKMILNDELFININEELLSSPESVWVSPVKEMIEICRENKESLNSQNPLTLNDTEIELASVPSLKQAERALKRLERVEQNEDSSSVRRYKKLIREGAEKGLSPFLSLLDNAHLQGNYTSKIPPVVKRFLCDYM